MEIKDFTANLKYMKDISEYTKDIKSLNFDEVDSVIDLFVHDMCEQIPCIDNVWIKDQILVSLCMHKPITTETGLYITTVDADYRIRDILNVTINITPLDIY